MKKHKNKIIIGATIAAFLVFVFWWGGDAPSLRGWNRQENTNQTYIQSDSTSTENKSDIRNSEKYGDIPVKDVNEPATAENKPHKADNSPMTAGEKIALAQQMTEDAPLNVQNGDIGYSKESGMDINDYTGKDKYQTESVPEGKPVPIEPENAVISDKQLTCTMSIRCDAILKNIAWLDKEKMDLVPKDGIVYAEQTVTFYEGESVFNLLVREMKRNKIHMEFENTPIYNSAYIEGIGNIYEFDCGELSGWMYKVNGWFPNYGCSRYRLKEGDRVEWVYTCDLGADVGGDYGARNGK